MYIESKMSTVLHRNAHVHMLGNDTFEHLSLDVYYA